MRTLRRGRLLSTSSCRVGDTTGVSSPSSAWRSVPPSGRSTSRSSVSGTRGPASTTATVAPASTSCSGRDRVQAAAAPRTAHNFTTFHVRIGLPTLACPAMADTFRFRNLDGSGPAPFSRALRWMVLDRLAGRRRRSPPRAAVPEVTPDVEVLRSPPAEGLRVTWLGHASFLVQGAGTSVLIDPVLGPRISIIRRNAGPGLRVDQLPRIDASLVTHNHYDHLDLPTLRAVGAPVVAGVGTRETVRGLPCTELAWWDRMRVGGLTVPRALRRASPHRRVRPRVVEAPAGEGPSGCDEGLRRGRRQAADLDEL